MTSEIYLKNSKFEANGKINTTTRIIAYMNFVIENRYESRGVSHEPQCDGRNMCGTFLGRKVVYWHYDFGCLSSIVN